MAHCSEADCRREAHAKGLCPHHYYLANKERINANSKRWQKENPEKARAAARRHRLRYPDKERERHARHSKPVDDEKRNRLNAASRQAQQETKVQAERNNAMYTSWELEIIADETRSVREAALATGRTYQAASRMRSLVRRDPKTILRAGIGVDGHI